MHGGLWFVPCAYNHWRDLDADADAAAASTVLDASFKTIYNVIKSKNRTLSKGR